MENQTGLTCSELRTAFAVALKEINDRVAEAGREYKLALKGIEIDWVKATKGIRQFKVGLPEQLKTLAMHGWFISGFCTPLKAIYPLASLFRAGRIVEGHEALCLQFNHALPDIENRLTKCFPNRAMILKKAFIAHKAGDCELSIPVFLAQADGIARVAIAETTARFSIYSQNKERQRPIEKFIDGFLRESLFTGDILKVALVKMPLNASEGDTMLKGEVLNRNAILHGTDTSYATPLNSCRAVSWLEYVSYFQRLNRLRGSLAIKRRPSPTRRG